ncbi:MAG: hypothetical protein JRN06_00315 [Nitrososphaerota archaeon]|nr:hypothetical protein [Nitrososphaerota archaeon]MDG7023704.1 hypothetical protein [Nitrososphaerota archaeon]
MSAATLSRLTPRWGVYFQARGSEFREFWDDFLKARRRSILYIMGIGFDPRGTMGLEAVKKAGDFDLECLAMKVDEGQSSPSRRYQELTDENESRIKELAGPKFEQRKISMWSQDGRRIGPRSAATTIQDLSGYPNCTDIVVDISSLPRGLYFPLVGKLLYLVDAKNIGRDPDMMTNLHVIVAENAEMDTLITGAGVDENASFVPGFTGTLVAESSSETPKIWIPILGEKRTVQFERIYDLVQPTEICPVLPSPSTNPRRGDNLMLEYRDLLLEKLKVDPNNFTYVSEQNPFETYRHIRSIIARYDVSLEALGGCQVIISALSNKLPSIGALLAAYEMKNTSRGVGMAYVDSQGYTIEGDLESTKGQTRLWELGIAGEFYAA